MVEVVLIYPILTNVISQNRGKRKAISNEL